MLSVTMGCPFTTYDRDNDNYDMNCAVWSNGGWWHSGCQNSCLNGLYGDDRYGLGRLEDIKIIFCHESQKTVMTMLKYIWGTTRVSCLAKTLGKSRNVKIFHKLLIQFYVLTV